MNSVAMVFMSLSLAAAAPRTDLVQVPPDTPAAQLSGTSRLAAPATADTTVSEEPPPAHTTAIDNRSTPAEETGTREQWRCPAECSCITQADGSIYDCSLPSGAVSFKEYGDGITFECLNGTLRCAEVPERGAAGLGALRAALRSVTLRQCALGSEELGCALRRRGGGSPKRLMLRAPRSPLTASHLRGLTTLTSLYIDELDGREMELPLEAMGELPELRQLTVIEAKLVLERPLPPLKLEKLELAEDALSALPPAVFRNLTHLTRLILRNNDLADLDENTFEGLGALQQLSLSSNALRRLPARLLRPTPLLTHLDLYDNPLEALPSDLLPGLQHLQEVRLKNNHVNLTLERRAFANLSSLLDLDLSWSKLHSIPPDLVEGSSALRNLVLAHCALRDLPDFWLQDLGNLQSLDLAHNALANLRPEMFVGLRNVTKLSLVGNQLVSLPSSVFLDLASLHVLRLDHNKLATLPHGAFLGLHSLRELHLSHNELDLDAPELVGRPQQFPFDAVPLLTQLKLSHNRIRNVLDDWRRVLVSLSALDLSWNNITYLDKISMNFLGSVEVDLRHNQITAVDPAAAGDGRGVFLLDDNPFVCDCWTPALQAALRAGPAAPEPRLVAPAARCAAPPALQGRALAEVPREELACPLTDSSCPPSCRCRLLPDRRDYHCDTLPANLTATHDYGKRPVHLRLDRVPPAIRSLPGLEKLDLSNLRVAELPPLPAGVEVNLTDNQLTRVPVDLLANNILWLAGNKFACDCSHSLDVAALQRDSVHVRDYERLTCASPERRAGLALRGLAVEALCTERTYIIIGVLLLMLLAVIVAIFLLVRRYGTSLLYWAIGCGFCPPDDDEDLEKKYDAFVSFAHQDLALAQEVVMKMETPPYSLKMCVHYRDWSIGDYIPEQITASVESSRRTIIVLSRKFLSSCWGLLEFREAHRRALTDGKARVIVVVVDDVLADERVTDELRAYLTTTTYLHRDDSRFWTKLAAAIRPRRRLAAALRVFRRRVAPPPVPPTVPLTVDKLLGSALQAKLSPDGHIVSAATAPSL